MQDSLKQVVVGVLLAGSLCAIPAVARVVMVEANRQVFAAPVHAIRHVLRLLPDRRDSIFGRSDRLCARTRSVATITPSSGK